MRVELKQWLRSHWGEMSANDRAKFPEQTLFLSPGGAGITSMREQYEHWLQILMMVSGFVLLIVCANVANLMLVRGMERRRQIIVEHGAGGASVAAGEAGPHRKHFALVVRRRGGSGDRICGHAPDSAFRISLDRRHWPACPSSASPSMPVLLFAFVISLVTGVAFGIAPAWMATRVDPIEALRGASRSTARTGSLPRKTLVVFQAALSLVLLSAAGLLTAALHSLENQDFGFEQDRRIVVNINPRLAGYRHRATLAALPAHPRFASEHSRRIFRGSLPILAAKRRRLGRGVWVDGHPAPGPTDDNFAAWDRVTAGYFDVIGNPIVRGRGISEQDTATSRHVAVINEAFARKFFKNEDPIGKHFGREAGSQPRIRNGGHRQRCALFDIQPRQADWSVLLSAGSTSRIRAGAIRARFSCTTSSF